MHTKNEKYTQEIYFKKYTLDSVILHSHQRIIL